MFWVQAIQTIPLSLLRNMSGLPIGIMRKADLEGVGGEKAVSQKILTLSLSFHGLNRILTKLK